MQFGAEVGYDAIEQRLHRVQVAVEGAAGDVGPAANSLTVRSVVPLATNRRSAASTIRRSVADIVGGLWPRRLSPSCSPSSHTIDLF